MRKILIRAALGVAAAFALAGGALAADLKVGLIRVLCRGPNSSLGIPYAKGMQAALAYRPEIAGHKVQLIVLDDASDPTTAGRNARKLIEEDKVDVLMGTSGVPAAIAMAAGRQGAQDADDRPDADRAGPARQPAGSSRWRSRRS